MHPGVAEGRYRVEDSEVEPPPDSEVRPPPDPEKQRTNALDRKSDLGNGGSRLYKSRESQVFQVFLDHHPMPKTYPAAKRHGHQSAYGHQAESAKLDHAQDHKLAKQREASACVYDLEPCQRCSRSRCEEGVQVSKAVSALHGDRNGQQDGPKHYDYQIAEDEDL